MPLSRILALAAMAALLPVHAHAHLGHVGEVAGHSHWLGYGALVAAGAALALLPRKRRKKEEQKGKSEPADAETETGQEPAA